MQTTLQTTKLEVGKQLFQIFFSTQEQGWEILALTPSSLKFLFGRLLHKQIFAQTNDPVGEQRASGTQVRFSLLEKTDI